MTRPRGVKTLYDQLCAAQNAALALKADQDRACARLRACHVEQLQQVTAEFAPRLQAAAVKVLEAGAAYEKALARQEGKTG